MMNNDPQSHSTPEEENDPLAPEPVTENSNVESLDTASAQGEEETGEDPRITALQKELDETKDQMLRVAAEAENVKRRALKDKEDARKYSTSSFARELLSVADNLRRALASVPADEAEANDMLKNLITGIEATEKEMLRAFDASGLKQIDPSGELFNPNYHEVMFETPGTGQAAGTIVEVIEPGYMLHDRLLRPARVGVAKDDSASMPGDQVNKQI